MDDGVKVYVATLTGSIGVPGKLGCTMLIVVLNNLPKVGDEPWGFSI